MAIQIINCPACGTFLLDDNAECHACGHVLNAKLAETSQRRSLPTDQAVDDDMNVCQTCNESVRKGLVRCWNCGSFMRADIEQAYRQRPTNASVDRDFDLPELDSSSVTEVDSMTRRDSNSGDLLPVAQEEDDGDDFELSEDVQMSQDEESEFDLADEIQFSADPLPSSTPRMEDSVSSRENLHLLDDLETIPLLASPAAEPTSSSNGHDLRTAAPAASEHDQELDTIPLLGSGVSDSSSDGGNGDAFSIPISPLGEAGSPGDAPAKPAESPEDDLLKIAAEEEAEISQVRKGHRFKESFVVYCPHGHRIRVRERFRGKSGKCPNCGSVFIVPRKSGPKPKKSTDVDMPVVGADAGKVAGRYSRWLDDIHLHNVIPEKLKFKSDSLLNDFQSVDVGFNANEILVVTLVASGGLFGGAAKKVPAARAAMLEYFVKTDASIDGLQAATKRVIPKNSFGQFLLVQPAPTGTESLFGNIPIFGTGRIAVRLPRNSDDKSTLYLSFSLSEFRAFHVAMQVVCGVEAFGANSEIPLSDQYDTLKCHYNETPVKSLRQLSYYTNDPNLKLEISGWKCGMCGLIVSEDGRKKEKIGGLDGKSIAKAKCPKCSQKFGSNPLYAIPDSAAPTSAEAAESTEPTAPA